MNGMYNISSKSWDEIEMMRFAIGPRAGYNLCPLHINFIVNSLNDGAQMTNLSGTFMPYFR